MGLLFDVLKKKPVDKSLRAIVNGQTVPIETVADETFASKVLGDGIAFEPAGSQAVLAPADGVVISASPDMPHAVGLQLKIGLDILIHIGIDTVEMEGKGFTMLVTEGQKVKAGQPLVQFDMDAIAAAGHPATSMLIFTDQDQTKGLELFPGIPVTAGETVIGRLD